MTAPDAVPTAKPVVIGLYGVPGSGKSTLLQELRQKLGERQFRFYEGFEVIASLVPGGLAEFQQATEDAKTHWRQMAIECIGKENAPSGRAAVVTGDFMFWSEGYEASTPVYTQSDLNAYTHIIYLDTDPDTVTLWRQLDHSRIRWTAPVHVIRAWQRTDKSELRQLCRNNGILFVSVPHHEPGTADRLAAMLADFRQHTEAHNLACAQKRLDVALATCADRENVQTAVVLDADGTLTAQDTGELFWEKIADRTASFGDDQPLRTLFGGPLGYYTYAAFRQATLLYEEVATDGEFDALCDQVAGSVRFYERMDTLLRYIGRHDHVVGVVVTCGLRRVWGRLLEMAGLSEKIRVVGGSRISDGFVVTAEVKRALVARLRDHYGLYVSAFGDSPLDLPMMKEAHMAVVVVGEEHSRSKTMDKGLMEAIDNGGLRAHQVLDPSGVSPRLDYDRLPGLQLGTLEAIGGTVGLRRGVDDRVRNATARRASKLLMTPMRDSRVAGPVLREAHRRVGWYLAIEFLPSVVGYEEYDMPHVQGRTTSGYRIDHEKKTTIVALMRGGEPMALGVSDGGRSRRDGGHIRRLMEKDRALSLIALRQSCNKFTGRGSTDTGNRLFNTTRLN